MHTVAALKHLIGETRGSPHFQQFVEELQSGRLIVSEGHAFHRLETDESLHIGCLTVIAIDHGQHGLALALRTIRHPSCDVHEVGRARQAAYRRFAVDDASPVPAGNVSEESPRTVCAVMICTERGRPLSFVIHHPQLTAREALAVFRFSVERRPTA